MRCPALLCTCGRSVRGALCHTLCTDVVWWEEAEELFGLANLYPSRMIETECRNRRSPGRCVADNPIPIPTKMFMPVVHPRLKQRNLVSRVRVDGFNAVGFL